MCNGTLEGTYGIASQFIKCKLCSDLEESEYIILELCVNEDMCVITVETKLTYPLRYKTLQSEH